MEILLYGIVGVFGLVAGSFLNALVWRVRMGKRIRAGRSVCTSCRKQICWYDNIPVLSFLLLRGKCRECQTSISWQYPIVELSTAVLFFFAFHAETGGQALWNPRLLYVLVIVFLFVFIFVFDARYKEILTGSTIYPAGGLFLYAVFFSLHEWHSMLIGAAVTAGFFFLQYLVSRGKWIGGGDVRYGVLMGVLLGWPHVIVGLFLAYVIGAAVSLLQIACGKKRFASETPFGTYLVIGTFIALFWGQPLLEWYLGFFA